MIKCLFSTSPTPLYCCVYLRCFFCPLHAAAKVGDISGADFTDALIRKDVAKALCARKDARGTNPTTGTDTRDSLLCDMF